MERAYNLVSPLQSSETTPRVSSQRPWLLGILGALSLAGTVWTYDALAYRLAARFEADHPEEPLAALERWQTYQAWHPTRNWLRPEAQWAEDEHLRDLQQQARQQTAALRLAELRRLAGDPDGQPDLLWQQFQAYRAEYGDLEPSPDVEQLRAELRVRYDELMKQRALHAYDEIVSAEKQASDLYALLPLTDRYLRNYPGSAHETEVRRLRAAYLRRIEEQDIEPARVGTARAPFDFPQRRQLYQHYLNRHPGGLFVEEAESALQAIAREWDRHDYRSVRDQFVSNPGDIQELETRCRAYRSMHPQGQFIGAIDELLRWTERVAAPGEYRVVLRRGHVERGSARLLSRGPDLSVELEVAGVRYGPSNVVSNRYDPEWNYEFPRRIRWKLGDPVRIRVTEHDYWQRVILDLCSHEQEMLAMQLLTGELRDGANSVTFESDFQLPVIPHSEGGE